MDLMLLKNCKFFEEGNLCSGIEILIDSHKILKIGSSLNCGQNVRVIDVNGNIISPGFIDLQVNGGGNLFFNNNINTDSISKILQAHSNRGTHYILPTLVTCELNDVILAIKTIKYAMKEYKGILGLHLEGPWISPQKPGAHRKSNIKSPNDDDLESILKVGEGIIKKITIAPEMFTDAQIQKLVDSNIIISAGHSNSSCEAALSSFNKGINCVTHLFNAMSPLLGKSPGLTGAALISEVYAGIIADGLHVHYKTIELAYRLKRDKLFLVSDASFTGSLVQGEANITGTKVKIINGKICTAKGKLAGASITLSDAVKNCYQNTHISAEEAIRMATYTPARLLQVESSIGQIKERNSSMLNILNENLELVKTINREFS